MEYLKPKTLQQASESGIKYGQESIYLNGGTDVIYRMDKNMFQPEVLIDIKGIPELKKLTFDKERRLHIGGSITINELGVNKDIVKDFSYLLESSLRFGGNATRNRATLVGNICNVNYPMPYFGSILLVLDAEIEIYHYEKEKRILSLENFFSLPKEKRLETGDVVETLSLPHKKGKGIYINESVDGKEPNGFSLAIYKDSGVAMSYADFTQSPTRLKYWEKRVEEEGLNLLLLKKMLLEITRSTNGGKEEHANKIAKEIISFFNSVE